MGAKNSTSSIIVTSLLKRRTYADALQLEERKAKVCQGVNSVDDLSEEPDSGELGENSEGMQWKSVTMKRMKLNG